eukprot:10874161-Heterocapsa_arctica.AAC.1
MAGSHQTVNQGVGRSMVPRLEKSPVVDVGTQLCRLCNFVPGGHVPVILGVCRVGLGPFVVLHVVGCPVGRGLQASKFLRGFAIRPQMQTVR